MTPEQILKAIELLKDIVSSDKFTKATRDQAEETLVKLIDRSL